MAIQGDADYIRMYEENYEDVLRFARRRVHPLHVDDVVSETFLAAWRRREDLPDDPRPWLFRTARNVMLNAQRGAHRQTAVAVKVAEHQSAVDPFGPDAQVDVADAWRSLSPTDQEVIALHVWEDLSAADACMVLGCSRAAYAMRLTRAKRRLRDRLTADAAYLPHFS